MEYSESKIPAVSVVIVVKNAEHMISRAVKSGMWAEEVLVVDTGSTDRTPEIARQEAARVVIHPWEGYSKTKQWGVDQAKHDWVFLLDADEEIPENLVGEIKQHLSTTSDTLNGFSCPRKNYFLGKWMRWGGWYPDRVVRLFCRTKGRFTTVQVHESIQVEGGIESLSAPLEHHTDETLRGYLEKLNIYTTLGAKDLADAGRQCRWWDLACRPIWTVLRMAIFKLGLFDGWRGALLAVLSGVHVLIKYAKLRNWDSEAKS
jgi:glycosyltransferase involved in cell wall biosynthesis